MTELKIDARLDGLPKNVGELASAAESYGFDGAWTSETEHDSFLPHPIAADRTTDLELGTRIALSFTRSPMVLAYMAWDLQAFSNGRFTLGLGTQVKGHNERRFSIDWESPGPRLREVIESLRHIFDVFQGKTDLDYDGEYYSFSLMTDAFNPGPIDHPDIPIYIAGVNEYNIQLAGELCDGLCVHGFNTPAYAEDVILPMVEEGAARGDRSLDDVDISVGPFTITGPTEEAIREQRENIRRRIAFYGSTRTYHDVLAHHGWEDIGMELHELSREQKWGEMTELVTDEMLYTFAVEAPVDEIAEEVIDTYGEIADRVGLSIDFDAEPYWEDIVAGFN